jgi:4-hydroxyphenylacetate 3-monooxygenase
MRTGCIPGRATARGDYTGGDVTTHPAFRNAARTVAAIYDMKADPANREIMSFAEGGDHYSMYYLQARTQEDLRRRMRAHRMIADMTYGLFGRSPDHVAGFVTGMAMSPDVFAAGSRPYAENIANYYRHMRDEDIYAAYAVVPPQAARDPAFYQKQNLPIPSLQVVREDDDGVVISGMKMLATAAVLPTRSGSGICCHWPPSWSSRR